MAWPDQTEGVLNAVVDSFGTLFTFIPEGGTPTEQCGIFDDEHEEVSIEVGGDSVLSTHAPKIGIRLSDFSQKPRQGDAVQRNGIFYEISDVNQDGQGGLELILHETDND